MLPATWKPSGQGEPIWSAQRAHLLTGQAKQHHTQPTRRPSPLLPAIPTPAAGRTLAPPSHGHNGRTLQGRPQHALVENPATAGFSQLFEELKYCRSTQVIQSTIPSKNHLDCHALVAAKGEISEARPVVANQKSTWPWPGGLCLRTRTKTLLRLNG